MDTISIIRHPELRNKPVKISPRKPKWIRVKAPVSKVYGETRDLVSKLGLKTVCEEAACPNIGECWSEKHVTVMILGDVCTRSCAFCNVRTGKPTEIDPLEPQKIAIMASKSGLKHIVVTSVDRDDLSDGGAQHFVNCIKNLRVLAPGTTVEVLTPDFRGKGDSLLKVAQAKPDVFNHNLETVPRLYSSVRRGARYKGSLEVLELVKRYDPEIYTKSGIMVGLGENFDEVLAVMSDMRDSGVDFITIGQYLQPTAKHAAVDRFVTPEEFRDYEDVAREKGFLMVSASPLTRSSYHADKDFERLKIARQKLTAT